MLKSFKIIYIDKYLPDPYSLTSRTDWGCRLHFCNKIQIIHRIKLMTVIKYVHENEVVAYSAATLETRHLPKQTTSLVLFWACNINSMCSYILMEINVYTNKIHFNSLLLRIVWHWHVDKFISLIHSLTTSLPSLHTYFCCLFYLQ